MADQDLSIIRAALIRELETINVYQDLRDRATDPAIRELLGHLMDEEKEHVAELTAVLRTYDPTQDEHFRGAHAVALAEGQTVGEGAVRPSGVTPRPPAPRMAPTGLTVGSLLGQSAT